FSIVAFFFLLTNGFAASLSRSDAKQEQLRNWKGEVHGHRGARAVYPENSLVGFKYAIEIGVDALELDLVVTKDGKLVINHDRSINKRRCLDEKGKRIREERLIFHLTLKEVQSYDCGSRGHRNFP